MIKFVIASLAFAATPAMACTDWKAVAAFDAAIAAYDVTWLSRVCASGMNAACESLQDDTLPKDRSTAKNDRDMALADNCREEKK